MIHTMLHYLRYLHYLPLGLLLAPGILTAQVATYTYVAQKAPYSNPSPPLLTALNLPKLGTTFQLQVPRSWVQRNRIGADYVLATGLSNPDVDIAVLGGFLFSSAEVLTPTPMSPLGIPGNVTMSLPIPNSVSLLGLGFHQQVLEATLPLPSSLRLSRGGHLVIGQ
jgi:hypothetical protein